MSGKGHDKAEKFIERLRAGMTRVGGRGGIPYQTVMDAVRDDPETAAEIVLAFCRQETLNVGYAQVAITVADAYEFVLGDDSLKNEVLHAPWYDATPALVFVEPDGTPIPRRDPVFPGEDGLHVIQVEVGDLKTGSVEHFAERLGVEGRDAEHVRKLSALWGMCRLRFDLPPDEPRVWKLPEVRRLVANLHGAMPYFPCYLNFRSEGLMFMAYFGSLADSEAFIGDGLKPLHPSVIDRVMESITAFDDVAQMIRVDPRPVWRTMLSLYPADQTDRVVKALYKGIYG